MDRRTGTGSQSAEHGAVTSPIDEQFHDCAEELPTAGSPPPLPFDVLSVSDGNPDPNQVKHHGDIPDSYRQARSVSSDDKAVAVTRESWPPSNGSGGGGGGAGSPTVASASVDQQPASIHRPSASSSTSPSPTERPLSRGGRLQIIVESRKNTDSMSPIVLLQGREEK